MIHNKQLSEPLI